MHVRESADVLLAGDSDALVARLARATGTRGDLKQPVGEVGAWRRSVPALLDVVCAAGLGAVEVLLEYRLPYSPKRVDAVLCGVDPIEQTPSYVLVELKQWSRRITPADAGLLVVEPFSQPQLHPSEQVFRYCRQLIDFYPSLAAHPDRIRGLAYLHNTSLAERPALDKYEFHDQGQLYTTDLLSDLVEDLTSVLDPNPCLRARNKEVAAELLTARKAPAKTLLTTAADTFAKRDDFVLLDEQKVAYDMVFDAVGRSAQDNGPKRVVIVSGGPGSGKSAVAISLLADLARQNRKAVHATGSKAFTETLRDRVALGRQRPQNVFTYFNSFGGSERDDLDVLICDEAHAFATAPPATFHPTGAARSSS